MHFLGSKCAKIDLGSLQRSTRPIAGFNSAGEDRTDGGDILAFGT